MKSYQSLINQALNAGFEMYCDTRNDSNVRGIILTNTRKDSDYNGEVIDLFEDGTFVQYGQFKGLQPQFKFK